MANRFGFLKNRKILFSIIAGICLILAAGAAYILFPGKNAREFYLEAESKNFKTYAELIKKTYKDFNEARQPYLSDNYKVRTEITADLKQSNASSGMDAINGIYDVIRKCKLVVDYKCNPVEKTSLCGLSLLLEKTPFVDAEIISRGQQMYFTVPVLTPDRYFGVHTDRLNEVYDRFNIPVRPLRVPNLTDVANAIEFNGEEFDSLASDLGKFISDHLKDEDVKYGKTVELTISGQKIKGREVSVNLGREESNALLKGLAAKAAGDDAFVKLTYGNFAAVSDVLDEAGIFQLIYYLDKTKTAMLSESERKFLKAIDITKDSEGFKNELSKLFDNSDFANGVKMDLIIDKAGNILDRIMIIDLKNTTGDKEYEINIHTGTNSIKYNDYRNRFLKVDVRTKTGGRMNSRQYFGINPAFTPSSQDGDIKGNFEIYWGMDAEDGVHSVTSAKFELDSVTDELTLKKNSAVKYDIEFQVGKEGIPDKISGEINTIKWKNNKLKTRNSTTDFTVNADLQNFGIIGFSAKFRLAREDKLELEPFALPEIPEGNVVDLNTATDEELEKVQGEIFASFGTFYMTNKPIIDAALGK